MASIPEYAKDASEATGEGFDAHVVCFTESPTFSIDYFRYRSFKRWKADLLYGIGFHKEKMVERAVRPVLYTDSALTKMVVSTYHAIRNQGSKAINDPKFKEQLVRVVDSLYPLMFPMLENHKDQGFMWEREWRCTDVKGFVFAHTDIAVICCPLREEGGIRRILGRAQGQIKFIRTWEEYDDVTDYLQRQQAVWDSKRGGERTNLSIDQRLEQLKEQIQARKAAANQLLSYADIINRLAKEAERAEAKRQEVLGDVERLEEEKQQLEAEKEKLRKEQTKPKVPVKELKKGEAD